MAYRFNVQSTVAHAAQHKLLQMREIIFDRLLEDHIVEEILPKARHLERLNGMTQAQLLLNVLDHMRGSRCRQCDPRHRRKQLSQFAQPQIVAPKRVTPFADTMRLIDDKIGEPIETLQGAQHLAALLGATLLRCDVQEACGRPDASQIGQDAIAFALRQFAVDRFGTDAQLGQMIDLVFDEGEQWRKDDGQPIVVQQTGQLKAQRFAGTGWHRDVDIVFACRVFGEGGRVEEC